MKPRRMFQGKRRTPNETLTPKSIFSPIQLTSIKEVVVEPQNDCEEAECAQTDLVISGSTSSTISPNNNQILSAVKSSSSLFISIPEPLTPRRAIRTFVRSPTTASLLLTRTSSVSPNRQANISTESGSLKLYPMSATQVLNSYKKTLTRYEQEEILSYCEVYYLSTIFHKQQRSFCDDRGMYLAIVGDHIAYRYEIISILGCGSFGMVLKCLDHKRKEFVAVKMLRASNKYKALGEQESSVLDIINQDDPEDRMNLIKKKRSFIFRNHFCIVFELLSLNLYDLLKKNESRGIELSLIRRFAIQLLIGLKCIHAKGIIHCDLKPENVVLRQENKSSVKIIDFGSACKVGDRLFTYLQSRYYRAPEVVLGCGYNTQIDMWSLGCILTELALGRPLFPADCPHDLILRIIVALGQPPKELLQISRFRNLYFTTDFDPIPLKSRRGPLHTRLLCDILEGFDPKFIDFTKKLLNWDPNLRLNAEDAISHEWIKGEGIKRSRDFIRKNNCR